MVQSRRNERRRKNLRRQTSRSLRTLLLVQQFEEEAQAIGARIGQARRERGLTQEQLAEMASFSKRSLQDYETGVTIPYKHLRELSRLLGRSVEWFLHGDQLPAADAEQWRRFDDRLSDLERTQARNVEMLAELLRIARGGTGDPQAGEDAEP